MKRILFVMIIAIGFQVHCYSQNYKIPGNVKRIVFLGNSITYMGYYVSDIDAYLTLKYPQMNYEVINVGLPSENVSGLSEPGHAEGRFPRPDLHDRLGRVLSVLKPDLVFACYGMNDGIYQPFDEERFLKYKEGIEWLHNEVVKTGATIIHITPSVYDERHSKSYSNVLDIYADWLLSKRYTAGWEVIDIHWPMRKALEDLRTVNPSFFYAKDSIHPDPSGHFVMAKQILLSFGEKEVAGANNMEDVLASFHHGDTIMKLVNKRQDMMKDAWLTHIGHKRPGMNMGLPIEEAKQKEATINKQIAEVLKTPPANPFGHALIPDMIADASIQEINGTFYCYATTDGYGQGLKTSGPPVVWKSKDFVNWSFSGTYFPSAAGQKYWAPSKAVAANGKFYIYPTINQFMYAAVSDSPEGPFKLASGPDTLYTPYTSYTLLKSKDSKPPYGIDAEIFIDDDKQAYLFWQWKKAARLNDDMVTVDNNVVTIKTPHASYSEGPIFFKRKGIYYYLYTIGGAEKYQYACVMGKKSPLGPFDPPKGSNIISTTNYNRQIYGPGHGCVFNVPGTDDYYFAYLEFGRGGTNRQTYVNKLEFNADGSVRPVDLTLDGVGALKKVKTEPKKTIVNATASSSREDLKIKFEQDSLFHRSEAFVPYFAFDGANGSRWMAAAEDSDCWIQADLGKISRLRRSEVYFVRPTAGHAYILEYSDDGKNWKSCGVHTDIKIQSPHVDNLKIKARYLRIRITRGVKGVWEWNVY